MIPFVMLLEIWFSIARPPPWPCNNLSDSIRVPSDVRDTPPYHAGRDSQYYEGWESPPYHADWGSPPYQYSNDNMLLFESSRFEEPDESSLINLPYLSLETSDHMHGDMKEPCLVACPSSRNSSD